MFGVSAGGAGSVRGDLVRRGRQANSHTLDRSHCRAPTRTCCCPGRTARPTPRRASPAKQLTASSQTARDRFLGSGSGCGSGLSVCPASVPARRACPLTRRCGCSACWTRPGPCRDTRVPARPSSPRPACWRWRQAGQGCSPPTALARPEAQVWRRWCCPRACASPLAGPSWRSPAIRTVVWRSGPPPVRLRVSQLSCGTPPTSFLVHGLDALRTVRVLGRRRRRRRRPCSFRACQLPRPPPLQAPLLRGHAPQPCTNPSGPGRWWTGCWPAPWQAPTAQSRLPRPCCPFPTAASRQRCGGSAAARTQQTSGSAGLG